MLAPGAAAVLEATREPCLLVDREGRVRAANRSAHRLLGHAPPAMLAQPLAAIVGGVSEPLEDYLRRCFASGEPTLGSVAPHADPAAPLRVEGSRVATAPPGPPLALLRFSPRSTAGARFVALNRQLGDLRNEIERRKRAEAALAAKVAEMQEADRQKSRFIALLSHELRNPLQPIRTLLHVIGRDPRADLVRSSVAMMERHLAHLVRLVDDLLDLSRIATGKIRVHIGEVSLCEAVELAAASVLPRIEAKAQRLELAVPRDLVVLGDADRLRQVLANLLDNACKFTPRDGHIAVEGAVEGGQAVVRVRDSGPGVPPEIAASVFDFFVQGESGEGRSREGLGLGLALARSVAQLQGGELSLAPPREGGGAEFVLAMPLPGEGREGRAGRERAATC